MIKIIYRYREITPEDGDIVSLYPHIFRKMNVSCASGSCVVGWFEAAPGIKNQLRLWFNAFFILGALAGAVVWILFSILCFIVGWGSMP